MSARTANREASLGLDAVFPKPNDSGFVLDDYLFYNLNHVSALYQDGMDRALRKLGIDQASWRVLSLLNDDRTNRVGEIARLGMMKIATLSRRLERMVADGLVLREMGSDDRRTVHVRLTPAGREKLNHARRVSAELFDKAVGGITGDELAATIRVLKHMRENLEKAGD
jgi:DNA-binding MarR family transcriptional regulator